MRDSVDNVATCGYIWIVKTVGIRQLKDRLSAYVAEVRRGEVVLVTDRSRVVAELRPPGQSAPTSLDPGLQRMAERGEITPGLAHDPSLYVRLGPCTAAGTAAKLIDEARGEP